MFWFWLGIALALVVFFRALMRANEMFVISVRNGRTLIMRGRVPLALHQELTDIVARACVSHATLRVVRSGGAARMLAEGVSPEVAQRLRNVLGIYPDHKLRAAPVRKPRNLGQWLGIPWLAWYLSRPP